jgi:SAM-dependent methyltransferase
MKSNRLYGDLAWIWPIMSPPEDYIEEAEFLTKLIKSYMSFDPKSMLHLGCGGGHIDMTFKKYSDITGIDISKPMLSLAKQLNPECEYMIGDMRDIRMEKSFDIVLVYDSVNYMLTETDLKSVFTTAYDHLNKGGIVLTVVEEEPYRFEQNKTKIQHRKSGDIELTYIEHWYDPDPKDSTYETDFVYLIRENKKLNVEIDQHICGMFELEIWEKLLADVGFEEKKDSFKHSTFSPGEEYPILIGFKNR